MLWPILVPCGSQYLDAVQLALEGIDKVKRFMRKDPVMTLVENAEEMEQVFIKVFDLLSASIFFATN